MVEQWVRGRAVGRGRWAWGWWRAMKALGVAWATEAMAFPVLRGNPSIALTAPFLHSTANDHTSPHRSFTSVST